MGSRRGIPGNGVTIVAFQPVNIGHPILNSARRKLPSGARGIDTIFLANVL